MPNQKRKRKSAFDSLLKQFHSNKKRKQGVYLQLIASGFFQTEKDWTEVICVYDDIIRLIVSEQNYKKQTFVIISGDGRNPQAGLLFALNHPSWHVHSIDPRLKKNFKIELPSNLYLHAQKIEDVIDDFLSRLKEYEVVLIIGIHSHGPDNEIYTKVCQKKHRGVYYISLPCCVKNGVNTTPHKHYINDKILSKCNEVFVWKN